jgi:hypothetical protein
MAAQPRCLKRVFEKSASILTARLPGEFSVWGTVHQYFHTWKNMGVWTCLQREIYEQTRLAAGRNPCASVVIVDGQSVKTTERAGVRGFDGHKRVKGRHILVGAWLGRNRRFSKDYEYRVQTSETCSTLPRRVSCLIASHQHKAFQTPSQS